MTTPNLLNVQSYTSAEHETTMNELIKFGQKTVRTFENNSMDDINNVIESELDCHVELHGFTVEEALPMAFETVNVLSYKISTTSNLEWTEYFRKMINAIQDEIDAQWGEYADAMADIENCRELYGRDNSY
tara:strand:- start:65 stop:457 length:393 start_codon:yes stop_codon:yes gene_type:complete